MQLTYVFPILILLFIGLFFFGCPSPASAVIENAPKSAFGRRDAIALGIITSVYAVTAFIGLGDTDAPQSFHDFHSGESVTVDLGEVRSIDGIMLYSGLNTGSYRIELSDDGNNFSDAGSFEQNYVALFKWNDFKLDALQVPNARYIRRRHRAMFASASLQYAAAASFSANAPTRRSFSTSRTPYPNIRAI